MMHSYISIWGLILQTGYYIILGYYIIRFLYYKVFIIRFILLFVGIMDPVIIHFYEVYYRIFMLSLIFK